MHFHIITLFPEAFKSYLAASIIGRAFKDKKIKVNFYNPRDFSKNSYKRVDQKPYGGGPGMVIEAEATIKAVTKTIGKKKNVKIDRKILADLAQNEPEVFKECLKQITTKSKEM